MTEGLRERKRRLAHDTMEAAAVQIAYEEGVAAVTVERVCDTAMVSRSTFFNYFPSLEVAIWGAALEYDPNLTREVLEAYPDDLVVAAGLIVVRSVRGAPDNEVTKQRFALFMREPGTGIAVSWASHTSRQRLIVVLTQWLDEHPEYAKLPGERHETEARIAVSLSIVLGDEALRHFREVGGDFAMDPEIIEAARQRMAIVAQVSGPTSA